MLTTKQIVIGLSALLGVRQQTWEQLSGHTADESFMVIRLAGIRRGHLRRIHSLIEDILAEERGIGERS